MAQQDGETAEDCAGRALDARDYVLRGTLPGAASVLILHEDCLQLILARAADLEAEPQIVSGGTLPECAVCVLDYTDGTYPYMVAYEKPEVRDQWAPGIAA